MGAIGARLDLEQHEPAHVGDPIGGAVRWVQHPQPCGANAVVGTVGVAAHRSARDLDDLGEIVEPCWRAEAPREGLDGVGGRPP